MSYAMKITVGPQGSDDTGNLGYGALFDEATAQDGHSLGGVVIGQITGMDPGVTDITFRDLGGGVLGDQGGRYEIVNTTISGVTGWYILVKADRGGELDFNYEGTRVHNIAVNAYNAAGTLIGEGDYTVTMRNLNEAPRDITFGAETAIVAGQTQAGIDFVKATWASDPDSASSFRTNGYGFLVNGNVVLADGGFTINSSTGQITTNSNIGSEAAGSRTLQVVSYVINSGNPDFNTRYVEAHTFTIQQGATNDAAPTVTGVTTPIEAVDNGAAVLPFGDVLLTNDDATTVTITFKDADGVLSGTGLGTKTVTNGIASYTISGASAADVKTILAGLSFNPTDGAANAPAVNTVFTIKATDATHPTADAAATGTVTVHTTAHVDTAPVIDGLTNAQVNEDAAPSTQIGIFSAHDLEDNQAGLLFELKDQGGNVADAGGLFAVDATGHLTVAKALPDGAGDQTFKITLKVSDKDGGAGSLSTYQEFTITVKDVVAGNHAPRNLELDGGTIVTIDENTTLAGKLSAQDDDNDPITWSFDDTVAGNANGLFEIGTDAATGKKQLQLKAGIDYEALGNDKFVMVYMKASDDNDPPGVSITQAFKINIKDINEGPDKIRLNAETAVTIAENKLTGTEVGTLTAHDPEGKAVTYALADSADGRFKLDATKTKILVADGARLDYEAAKFHDIKVVATDADGQSSEQVIRINLSDVDETPPTPTNHAPGSLMLTGAGAAAEYAVTGTEVGTLSAADADSDALTYTLLNNADGRFMLSGNKILVADGFRLDFEQATAHMVTVQVSDGKGGVSQQSFAIGVTDVAREVTGGSPANDVFKAGKYNDKLFGGSGNDKLYGGAGNDYLKGHGGNDVLWGGAGKDILYAGAGKDVFVFDAKFNKKTNVDKILDFVVKDDSIWLDNALFKANKSLYAATKKGTETKPLKMASKFFTVGDKAKDKDDFFVYDSKKGVLYYDADGSGSKAAVEIATLKKGLKMTYKDFFFI